MFTRKSAIKESLHTTAKSCFSYIKGTSQIPVFSILLGGLAIVEAYGSKSVLSVEDVNAVIPLAEAAERVPFSNLKVDSEAWGETKTSLTDPNEPWQRTPIYLSCTAWFGGGPQGKARVDVHKEVLRWQGGAAPYGESTYSVGFDGQYGRVVHHTFGHSGKIHGTKRAKRLTHAPGQLKDSHLASCTGARFSFQFFFSDQDKDEGRTFPRLFRAAISPTALEAKALEVALEEFQGVECIKLGSGEKKGRAHISYWFDPARGFALVGHDNMSIREDGSEWVSARLRVTKLKKVAPGLWWPTEATFISRPIKSGDPYSRTVYRATNVVANDPDFDDSVFTVPFPDGYLVDDQVADRKYRVGEK